MVSMAAVLIGIERRTLAEWLTGKQLASSFQETPKAEAMCKVPDHPDFDQAHWNGWSPGADNTRYDPSPGLSASAVPRLAVKWAFALPGEQNMNPAVTLAGGRVFLGSPMSKVYSLDQASGCLRWWFQAASSVRGAIRIERIGDRHMAFFGDAAGSVYALDPATGKEIWRVKVDDQPFARIIGSIAVYEGRLYVPLAAGEELVAYGPKYECCKFRGSVVALDARSGKQVWKTYMIAAPAKPVGKNKAGTTIYGPSGVAIWSAPMIDAARGALVVTTGNNYSGPATANNNAVISMDLGTGKIQWSRSAVPSTPVPCASLTPSECDAGALHMDYAAPPMLVSLGNGKRALVASHKSGMVFAFDANTGNPLWSHRAAKGGDLGGILFGAASDGTNVYAPISDLGSIKVPYGFGFEPDPKQGGGIVALRVSDGKAVWSAAPPKCGPKVRCSPAQMGAASVIPGAVFSGSADGHIRAYATANGRVIWDFDTRREFKTANGVPGHGGALNGAGPVFGGGMMFVNSGSVVVGEGGNVLLAFSLDGK